MTRSTLYKEDPMFVAFDLVNATGRDYERAELYFWEVASISERRDITICCWHFYHQNADEKMKKDAESEWRHECASRKSLLEKHSNELSGFGTHLYQCFNRAKKTAPSRNIEFSITFNHIIRLWKIQNGTCPVTKFKFGSVKYESSRSGDRDPTKPSIDRIDSSKGYVHGNVRIVTTFANQALHTWGEEWMWKMLGVKKESTPSDF